MTDFEKIHQLVDVCRGLIENLPEWQPIETAPPTECLVWGPFCGFAVSTRDGNGEWWEGDYRCIEPTHWMPLPEAPK